MAEIINLRLARKARDRARSSAEAPENRARHGLTAAERKAQKLAEDRLSRTVDGARRESLDDNPC